MRWSRPAAGLLLAALSACNPRPGATAPVGPQISKEAPDSAAIRPVAYTAGHRKPAQLQTPRPTDRHAGLGAFYAALSRLERGESDAPITILQIGDSHTAGDYLSGEMRRLLQERFGGAGRGILPPGIPDKYYRPDLVKVTESAGWERVRANDDAPGAHVGIANLAQRAVGADQHMSVTALEEAGFDRGFVEVSGEGVVQIGVDDRLARRFDVAQPLASAGSANWIEFDVPKHSHALTVTSVGGGMSVLSWGIERRAPGILYSNLGTIGATAGIIDRWDETIVGTELQRLDPALIVVAFGTNEAFGKPSDLGDYRDRFVQRVAMLARAAPDAAILILGPPDANRRYPRNARGAGGCTTRQTAAAPLAATPKKGRDRGWMWATPPQLDEVRQFERAAATSHGWYFFDWSAAMGGACSAHRWAVAPEPLVGPDHVHQTIAGYRRSASYLFDDIMAGYAAYRADPSRMARPH